MAQKIITGMDIKDNLKSLREKSGLSQEDVATKLQTMGIKMSRSWLSAIECGNRNLQIRVLVGLKIVYRCSYSDFFAGLEEELLEQLK